jgi:hypothetical protein
MKNVMDLLETLSPQLQAEVAAVVSGEEMSDELYEALFDSPLAAGMPYGTAKARTGDPVVWLTKRLQSHWRLRPRRERTMKLYKFTVNRQPLYGQEGFKYSFKSPNLEPKATMCYCGFHAVNSAHLYKWAGTELWQVELTGGLKQKEGKWCGKRLVFLKRDRRWNKKKLLKYARGILVKPGNFMNELHKKITKVYRHELYLALCQELSEHLRFLSSRGQAQARVFFNELLKS